MSNLIAISLSVFQNIPHTYSQAIEFACLWVAAGKITSDERLHDCYEKSNQSNAQTNNKQTNDCEHEAENA